jgi:hypothetical protein
LSPSVKGLVPTTESINNIMSENSVYFENITSRRGMLLDAETALEGNATISLETQSDLAEDDVLTYVQENFGAFVKAIRYLSDEDQEMLLSYYMLSKTQNMLAEVHRSTQTACSFQIRMAMKKIGTFLLLGEPTVEVMQKILTKAGLEDQLSVGLSQLIKAYEDTRSFQKVANAYGLHRPDIRRAMSRASHKLNESQDSKECALGAFIHGLIDKASAAGQGLSKRKLAKRCHVYRRDPAILGEFRVNCDDPHFEHLFTSRANR